MKDLSGEEWQIILESLKYSKLKFEASQDYPSPEFKKQKINEVNDLMLKIKGLKKNTP